MNFKLLILYYLLAFKINKIIYENNWAGLRKKRFKLFLKRLQNSPYYGPYLLSAKNLADFPVISKQVFMEKFDDINTRQIKKEEAVKLALEAEASRNFTPMIGDITVGLSSGTSGSRGIFLANNRERARWVACVLDRVIGFSLKKRKVAFFLRANSNLYSAVQSGLIQFHFFDLFSPVPDNINLLKNVNPNILVAQPSMLIEIAHAIENNSLNISPVKIISVAEVLTPEDKKYLEKVFKQTIHQVYQCTEGFLAFSCKEGNLHFNEDLLIIEKKYLDAEKL
ncbi:MAG: F390 synthetase-related protein, partial [Chitinophagaceae bacterium]